MSILGYARVSTTDQTADGQHDALTASGCERIFTDVASGKLARRPQLDALIAYARAGDVIVITKLDRLGRSVAHLVELAGVLAEWGIDLRVLHQGIDTSTPGGRLTFHILASIAEFERDLISERTRDGLAAARARGRKGGRRPALSAAKVAHARTLRDGGRHDGADRGAGRVLARDPVPGAGRPAGRAGCGGLTGGAGADRHLRVAGGGARGAGRRRARPAGLAPVVPGRAGLGGGGEALRDGVRALGDDR